MNTFEEFLAATAGAEQRLAVAAADTRTDEQIYDEVGALFEVAMNALWNRASDADKRAAAKAFNAAMSHPSAARLYIHAPAVNTGDYIQANGLGEDGRPDSATGVVEEIDEETRSADLYGAGEVSSFEGFTFAIRPVVANDRPQHEQVLIWVPETGMTNVLRLPKPTHHSN